MNVHTTQPIGSDARRVGTAVDNLRGVVVLMVIAVHTVLAYAAYAPSQAVPFGSAPWLWQTFPVVDSRRFIGFDIFCAWANISLMPLFFLVSGFFVWKSIERNGALRFAWRRAVRLGPPFLLGVAVVLPIAIYPAYAERTPHPALFDYLRQLRDLPFWPDGPLWFLFVLLVFDLLAACLFVVSSRARNRVRQLAFLAGREPAYFLAGFFVLSALAYIPLGTVFGPMHWFQWGPIAFQLNFIALYLVYFGAGVVLGASGLEGGLFHPDFARRWKRWLAAAIMFFAAWLLVSAKTFTTATASTGWMLADAIALVPACFAGCLCAFLFAVQFGGRRTRLLQSLQANAFGMYWVHYAVITWLQFALLAAPIPAIVKAVLVFMSGAALSWVIAAGLRRTPILHSVLGVAHRPALAPVVSPLHSSFTLAD